MKTQQTLSKIYGTLQNISVELPPASVEEHNRQVQMNQEIAHLGVRTYRSATDWGYVPAGVDAARHKSDETFQSGDLVKIFKTISSGDVHWDGVVDLDRSDYYGGLQKGMDKKEWGTMFHRAMSAKLEKTDGTVMYGALEAFYEQGMEYTAWSLMEYGKNSYAALNAIDDGDRLTVYDRVLAGDVDWEGRLSFKPRNPQELELSKNGWSHEVMRETLHMPTKDWLLLSWQNRPFVMERSKKALKLS